jgi:hypothetical protein
MTTIYMGQVALGPFLCSVLLRLISFRRNALIPVVDNFLAVISIPVAISPHLFHRLPHRHYSHGLYL